jgi:hypothetical protein
MASRTQRAVEPCARTSSLWAGQRRHQQCTLAKVAPRHLLVELWLAVSTWPGACVRIDAVDATTEVLSCGPCMLLVRTDSPHMQPHSHFQWVQQLPSASWLPLSCSFSNALQGLPWLLCVGVLLSTGHAVWVWIDTPFNTMVGLTLLRSSPFRAGACIDTSFNISRRWLHSQVGCVWLH